LFLINLEFINWDTGLIHNQAFRLRYQIEILSVTLTLYIPSNVLSLQSRSTR